MPKWLQAPGCADSWAVAPPGAWRDLFAEDAREDLARISAQKFAPLNKLRHIETPIADLDPPHIGVGALKTPGEFTLRDACLLSCFDQSRHQPAMTQTPELLRQSAVP